MHLARVAIHDNPVYHIGAGAGAGGTADGAKAVWDHRSDVAHGRDPWAARQNARKGPQQPPDLMKDDPTVRRYLQAEQLLRATILKCPTDRPFAAMFNSDASVEQVFPV